MGISRDFRTGLNHALKGMGIYDVREEIPERGKPWNWAGFI